MTLRNLQATKAEQYTNASVQAIKTITENQLELAAKHVRTAQYVKYDLDTEVTRMELRKV